MRRTGFLRKKYTGFLISGLLGWIVCIVGDMADSVFAGIYINEAAVSAVELVAPIFSILMFLCCFIAIGISTLYSRAMGAFERDLANGISGLGLIVSIASGIILAASMVLLKDVYFNFYSSSAAVEAYAREYYNCFIILALIYPTHWLLYYLLTADGDATLTLVSEIVSAVANTVLSLLLVNVWGIKGLGYGTLFSVIISEIPILLHFLKKSNSIRFKFFFSWKYLKQATAIGSSSSLTYLYIAIVDIVINKFIITQFGDAYLAAYTVVNLIINLGGCFLCAASAAGVFVSVSYGENNPVAIRNVMRLANRSSAILGAAFMIVMELVAKILPGLYGITDPEVFSAAVYAGRVLSVSYLAISFVEEWICYFPKVDRVVLGNAISVIYMLVTPLLFPIPLALMWGFRGLVWGFFLSPVVTVLLHLIYVSMKYGIRKFPLLIPEPEYPIFIHETTVNTDGILALQAEVAEDLRSCGVEPELINKAQLMVEETFLIVQKKNAGKRVLGDCTLMVRKDKLHLITRDNGIIFDITDTNAEIKSLRQYVAARLMENSQESSNLTTTSFNRNSYIWERSPENAPDCAD